MNSYKLFKDENKKDLDKFIGLHGFFAFNNKQFDEGKAKISIIENTDLLSIKMGGYIKKDKKDEFHTVLKTMKENEDKILSDDEMLYQAFMYELSNHEYCITYDIEDTLDALGISEEKFLSDQRMIDIFQKARKEYLSGCE